MNEEEGHDVIEISSDPWLTRATARLSFDSFIEEGFAAIEIRLASAHHHRL